VGDLEGKGEEVERKRKVKIEEGKR